MSLVRNIYIRNKHLVIQVRVPQFDFSHKLSWVERGSQTHTPSLDGNVDEYEMGYDLMMKAEGGC